MIISTVSLKGGAGKSTTAVHLAVFFALQNNSVIIVDTDENDNISYWNDKRPETAVNIDYVILNTEQDFKKDFDSVTANYDIIVIDGRPAVNNLAGFVLSISDVAIIPMKASAFDTVTTKKAFLSTYQKAKSINSDLRAFFLLNEIKQGSIIAHETRCEIEALKQQTNIHTLQNSLSSRVTYPMSIKKGLSVLESDNDAAKGEVLLVCKEILKNI